MNEFVINVRDFIFENKNNIRSIYRIGKRVGGEGSYGFIRFCIHKKTGCLRAVKVIDKSCLDLLDQAAEKDETVCANKEI